MGADDIVVAVMDSGKLEHSLNKTAEGRKAQPLQAVATSRGQRVEHYITRRAAAADRILSPGSCKAPHCQAHWMVFGAAVYFGDNCVFF